MCSSTLSALGHLICIIQIPCMHHTCANLLRRAFNCEDSRDLEQLIQLVEIEMVLGRPCPGYEDGIARFPHVKYEEVSGIDMRHLWAKPNGFGDVFFDFVSLKNSEKAWILSRPDLFPKFNNEVQTARLTSIGEPGETTDIVATVLPDILFKLIAHFDISTYLSFTSTCRTLRKMALKEFQPHARKLVLSLPWSTPLLNAYDKSEYTDMPGMVHSENSPPTGDWLLYLSHIHRTNSMRTRRRIWKICEEIKQQYDIQRPFCAYSKDIRKQDGVRNAMNSNTSLMWTLKPEPGKKGMNPNQFAKIWTEIMGKSGVLNI